VDDLYLLRKKKVVQGYKLRDYKKSGKKKINRMNTREVRPSTESQSVSQEAYKNLLREKIAALVAENGATKTKIDENATKLRQHWFWKWFES
jgi:hypothetical protein